MATIGPVDAHAGAPPGEKAFPETPTGQSRLAYQLAAVLLLVDALFETPFIVGDFAWTNVPVSAILRPTSTITLLSGAILVRFLVHDNQFKQWDA